MLSVLGLDELQERAYRRLVQLPSGSATEVAEHLRVDLPDVVAALESLESMGLAARSVASPEHFTASPPELALGSLIVERQQDIRRAELELHALTELFRGAASERVHTDVIDVVRGRQAVAQHFAQLQRGARREVCALVKPEVAVVTAEENVDEKVALDRGVTYKVVVEKRAFEQPGFSEMAAESAAAGEQIRVAESVPLRLLVTDRELALLPLVPDETGGSEVGALLVRPSGLLDALLALFDLVWQQANPIHLGPDDSATRPGAGLEEIDRHLLTLLQAGLTDQAIVGQLGMSLRTVQRRVHQLMAEAGVTTRFQLGSTAARRGWLPRG
ncbi:helix-turn-helix domain-containing protein [Agromyces lapidis]|uniref:Helix-turn-helix domain-containing protein n=1 Tax=Agromyces lapidis TaxID=279574 RepID=A0ABV5SPN8_9MICO|nr:helix-turn-helix domain-containing protein [Agromyces lapidis]